jgi:LPXTG-motif cell wall-anchored protein
VFDTTGQYNNLEEFLQEGQPYDVSITADGQVIASKSGVGDCEPNTPPTTTPTPPTTTPPATTPTTLVSSGPSVTVASAAAASPTTTARPAALPYTGSGSKALAAVGIVLLIAGGSTVIALRKRATA